MDELPEDWWVDHDGQSSVLDPNKVAAEIRRLRAALELIAGSSSDRLQAIQARQALVNIG
jgi:hypothetical protein